MPVRFENGGSSSGSGLDPTGLPIINLQWKAQAAWYIDPVSGNDANIGNTSGTALKTWKELRRRMLGVDGHNDISVTITIMSSLASNDPMIVDWKGPINVNNSITVQGITSVVRSSSFTSAPTFRNAATNQTNVAIDSTVTSWTADVGATSGRLLVPSSGGAQNLPAWIIKDLGSHSARMTSFYDPIGFNEGIPSNGDTYDIIQLPFVPNYILSAPNESLWIFQFLHMGDTSSSSSGFDAFNSGFYQFNYCVVASFNVDGSIAIFGNCANAVPVSAYGAAEITFDGGYQVDTGSYPFVEYEDAADISWDTGHIVQGIQIGIIDGGYLRCYDGSVFDSSAYGISIRDGSRLRIGVLWGSGNGSAGLQVQGSGEVFLSGSFTNATITGPTTDVEFCTFKYTWATLNTMGYIKSQTSFASISLQSAGAMPAQNQDNLICIVSGVNLKNTGQTALLSNLASTGNAVPGGLKLFITDVKIVTTNVSAVTGNPNIGIGVTPSYNTWIPASDLPTFTAANQMISTALYVGLTSVVFPSGSVPKFDVKTAATATALTVDLHVFGYFY